MYGPIRPHRGSMAVEEMISVSVTRTGFSKQPSEEPEMSLSDLRIIGAKKDCAPLGLMEVFAQTSNESTAAHTN